MARKVKKKEVLTFNLNEKKYLYDGIISFVPVLIEDDWVISSPYGSVFRLPIDCMSKVQRSDGKAIYVILKRNNQIIADYFFENMSYLATRDGISGKKWDDLIEA